MGKSNPVVQGGVAIGSILSLFEAFIVLARSMGWIHIDNQQTQDLLSFIRIALPVLVTAGTTWWVSRQTTSLSKPRDIDGERLVKESTGGLAIKEQRKSDERSIQREKEGKL